jgi:hypothetical protein
MGNVNFKETDYPEIRRLLLRCWVADTFSIEAIIMKIAADKAFRSLTNHIEVYNRHHLPISEEEIDRFLPVVRWMYKETQEHLVEVGIKQNRKLFRGVNENNAILQPLMSYTDNERVAEKYSKLVGGQQQRGVFHLPVSPERIFMYFNGPGWDSHFDDLEYIIICDKDWESEK